MAAIEQIPFFLSEVGNIEIDNLQNMDKAKKGVMTRFISRAKEVHQVGTSTLLNTYREWNNTNEGSISSLITQELERIMGDYNSPKMTGASFFKDVQARVEQRDTSISSTDIDQYASMAEEIESRLNAMIDILMKEKPTIELVALCNCIGRKIPDPELARKYEGKGVNLAGIEGKKASTLQTLQNYYHNLLEAGKGNVAALTLPSGEIPSPKDIAKAVAGTLSSVAGESFYEILVSLVANRIIQEFNQVDEETIKAFLANGFSLMNRTKQSADVNLSGQQGKPDLYISWNENGLILKLGGSVKLRQADNDFSNGKFVGKISYSLSLREVFNYANQISPSSAAKLKGALGAVLKEEGTAYGSGYVTIEDLTPYANAWEEIKQRAVLLGVVDKFAGTGELNEFGEANFADALIINQEVIPMYRIFQDVALNGLTNGMSASGQGWTWKFDHTHFPYWQKKSRKQYHTKSEKSNGESLRTSLYDSMLQSIYGKKIQISLSLNKLT